MKKRTNNTTTEMTKVKDYIDLHFTQDLSISEMAEMAHMSQSSFIRHFKAYTGTAFSQYVIDARLALVYSKLQQTNEEVKSICYHSGFNTQTNFNRLFKKKYGCTPMEVRMRQKRNH